MGGQTSYRSMPDVAGQNITNIVHWNTKRYGDTMASRCFSSQCAKIKKHHVN